MYDELLVELVMLRKYKNKKITGRVKNFTATMYNELLVESVILLENTIAKRLQVKSKTDWYNA